MAKDLDVAYCDTVQWRRDALEDPPVLRELGSRRRVILQRRAQYDAGVLDIDALLDEDDLVKLALKQLRFMEKPPAGEPSKKLKPDAYFLPRAKQLSKNLILVRQLFVGQRLRSELTKHRKRRWGGQTYPKRA